MKRLRLGDYFVTYGWLLPVFAVVGVIGFYWPISAINEIKPYERISIFAECYEYKDETLPSDLATFFEGKGVADISINPYPPDSDNINSYYTAFGESSDILLLTKSSCDSNLHDVPEIMADWIGYSDSLKEELGIPEGAIYYDVGGGDYGLMVYNATDPEYRLNFSEFGSFAKDGIGEDVYLLLRSTSPNFGEYGLENVTTNALETVTFLLERYAD